jgi:DMSO/TMAO reductase YedYZ molybdopterin-dependent catalytic subunit
LALGSRLLDLPFVPFDIFDWMARTLPGGLIRFVIESMVTIIKFLQGFLPIGDISTAAKLAEQSIAITQFIVGGAVFGGLLAWIRTKRDPILFGQIGGLLLLAFAIIIESSLGNVAAQGLTIIWLGLLFVAWGWLLAALIQRVAQAPQAKQEDELSRRQFLAVSGAGLATAALGAWGVSRLFGEAGLPSQTDSTPSPVSGKDPFGATLTSGPAASPSPKELSARIAPAKGTRPELTANEDFYRIDIDTIPPEVDASTWKLQISGLVDTPINLDLDQIRAMPSQTQILTMQCISNPVGGDLTSSSRWTGVRAKDLLDGAGIQASAAGAFITAADGFYEFVTMEDLQDERTLFVYAMNGEPLPREHGFPLRIYIPNRYGMKQPKWIETIEMVAAPKLGYWVERGWDLEARPETVSVVDTVVVDPDQGDNGMAICGGIAWAGTRGISKVEVQIDNGDWVAAELILPPLSTLNWVLWRYAFPYQAGSHTVSVQSYDGKGTVQISNSTSPGPGGATGIHYVNVNL